MESHNKGSFWTTLEKEACDNNDHCGGKGYPRNVRATWDDLEDCIYLQRAHAQHMHMNTMIDEGRLCCTSWCSCGFCHQAAESTKIQSNKRLLEICFTTQKLKENKIWDLLEKGTPISAWESTQHKNICEMKLLKVIWKSR